ncbi:MAG: ABC transporter permease [Haloarculaceae archaeon]
MTTREGSVSDAATAASGGRLGRFATAGVVLAVLTVQLTAFAILYAIGQPTLYALFALASAAALGYASQGGLVGVAAAALGSVMLLVLALPIAMFFANQDPSLVVKMARDPQVHRMLVLTVYGPFLAALVALAFGVPLAFALSEGFPGQPLVESLVDLPLVIPHSVAGILILFGFGKGAAFPQVEILGTLTGMVIALTFVSAPFAVNAAREAFESVDPRLGYAARVHGAGPVATFVRVTLPLSARGILTGGVLAWARSVSEFGSVAIVAYTVSFFFPGLGEVSTQHAPVFIFNTYVTYSLQRSGAVAAILLVLSAAIFLLVRWLAYDGLERGTP